MELRDLDLLAFDKTAVEQSIPTCFEKQVTLHPDHIALKSGEHFLTYEQLNTYANKIAHAILLHEKSGGKPIALLLDHGINSIVALLAVLKTGNFFLFLDSNVPEARNANTFKHTTSRIIITDDINETYTQRLDTDAVLINIDKLDDSLSHKNPDINISPDAMSYVIYTSGTTGVPKGVMHSHQNGLHQCLRLTHTLKLSSTDKTTLLSTFTTAQAISITLYSLLNGTTLYPLNVKRWGLSALAEMILKEDISILHLSASLFRYLSDTLAENAYFPSVRVLNVGSEPVHRTHFELFKKHFSKDSLFVNALSSSEMGTLCAHVMRANAELTDDIMPVGLPLSDMEITLQDEAGNTVAPGMEGEIVVKSPYIALGYYNNPTLTEKIFSADPLAMNKRIYRTGDLGKINAAGQLQHLGRKDFQIKIRGFRVETSEIEMALESIPSVKQAVVTAKDASAEEKYLVAYLTINKVLAIPEIKGILKKKLPDYMMPAFFSIVDKMPLTASGKVDVKALPDVQPEKSEPVFLTTENDELTVALQKIWQEVFKCPVSLTDDFHDLGGHSLLAMQLIAKVEQYLQRKLPIKALIRLSNINEMATIVKDEENGTEQCPSNYLSMEQYRALLAVVVGAKELPVKPGSLLVGVNLSGKGIPLFWCGNELNGLVGFLGEYLGTEQPFYIAFSGKKVLDIENPEITQNIAAHYAEEIAAIQQGKPCFIAGNCSAGSVATELSFLLLEKGIDVKTLFILEAFNPKLFKYPGKLVMILAKRSFLKCHELFNWGKPAWRSAFQQDPDVLWLPGPHGIFNSKLRVKMLGNLIAPYLIPNWSPKVQIGRLRFFMHEIHQYSKRLMVFIVKPALFERSIMKLRSNRKIFG